MKKVIYFAGGCFWGVEHFFKGVDGVVSATPGYANGSVDNPSYEQVYTDTTGHVETVKVVYDDARVSLERLLKLFFASIDPLDTGGQGHDRGTRYRTGVYYSDPSDLPVLEAGFAALRSRLGVSPATELLRLKGFWPAEERHRDYLDKNPGGYCHLDLKVFKYLRLYQDLALVLEGEPDAVARQAQTAAMIYERMKFFWVGFYRVLDGQLVLGPFQGPHACFRIAYGRGVCGTAWKQRRTIIVSDVDQFPGHIACSSESRSEIVVPLFADKGVSGSESSPGAAVLMFAGKEVAGSESRPGLTVPTDEGKEAAGDQTASPAVCAVLDIDSQNLGTFDQVDAIWLEMIAALVWRSVRPDDCQPRLTLFTQMVDSVKARADQHERTGNEANPVKERADRQERTENQADPVKARADRHERTGNKANPVKARMDQPERTGNGADPVKARMDRPERTRNGAPPRLTLPRP